MDSIIVFIDVDCIFCNYWANYILENDRSNKIFVSSSRSIEYKKIKEKFSDLPNPNKTIFFLINGIIYQKSSAVIQIGLQMKGRHKLLIIGYIIPKFIRDYFYMIISNRRKTLMKDQCKISSLKKKNKFIS